MALTAKPTKNIDLSKIDDIQNEFFGQQAPAVIVPSSDPVSAPMGAEKKGSTSKPKAPVGKASKATRSKDRSPKIDPAISSDTLGLSSGGFRWWYYPLILVAFFVVFKVINKIILF